MNIMELSGFHSLFGFLLCGLTLLLLVQAQDQSGFISLDCGTPESTSYTETTTKIDYVSDAPFINSGVSGSVASIYGDIYQRQMRKLRSFPEGIRNCYNVSVKKDTKYLIRANFLYGNYDGLNLLPQFDLYIGNSLWETINFTKVGIDTFKDLIHVTSSKEVHICLINTGNGVPFISALEFRPLLNITYQTASGSLSLYTRLDIGSTNNQTYRFPFDVYDRLWSPFNFNEWTQVSTNQTVDATDHNNHQPPSVVMKTASTPINASKPLEIWWDTVNSSQYYVFIHFAEVVELRGNQSRGFNIMHNGDHFYGPLIPSYLSTLTVYSREQLDAADRHTFSLVPIENATLPPIINAFEIYTVKDISELASDKGDVDAITNIKSTYGVTKDWQGDPCVPMEYPWSGLNCSNEAAPRITSLNLSTSGLNGEISSYISKLTMLQTLDLSNNNLTGKVPDFLSSLLHLKILNLGNNNLSGPLPADLLKRSNDGSLSLSVGGNQNLDACTSDPCPKNEKKNNIIIPIVASIGGVLVIVTIAAISFWIIKSRKKPQGKNVVSVVDKSETNSQFGNSLEVRRQQFTYSEVVKMTNNFTKVLGKGGFGEVYYGVIDDIQVAVKMLSLSSSQGYRQFQAEVTLLMRVHHRNLTSLVGYLNEGNHLGLIYEYMANGDLAEHLSESSPSILSWEDRLRIAIDAAQGLEYLHYGCKPPIVHRDVKTTNILLTDNFQGKLADFGLSKSFPIDGNTHMSTVVAGTPGYLDPEYYVSNRLTEKSDVYSFGIALLEIISCKPVISRTGVTPHIAKWATSSLAQGDIQSIVDPRLQGQYDTNSVWKTAEVAMACVAANSSRRPTMNDVVAELKDCLAMELSRKLENRSLDSINSIQSRPISTVGFSATDSGPMAR
ncbi:LRR receptor-like serine/threonine-protein kinase IOS1 [Cucurbita pepo subsp. pepo]|uniref:LRR receptor-like serine/threonine-protein kinase IOS1 n=1 Tax=Cucurbita pepo subsp. pepo TaxID=3664 RepID=UPI000C9D86E5|nr:LRR receptor-like serine/threonine-protein kinase IOS1 [Cucurbita pepo subsp. pepo]